MSKAIKFLQASHIAGKDYAHNSVHPLSDELIAHPYFQKLVNAGLVVEAEAIQVITPASIQERQKALADYMASKSAAKKAKADEQKPSSDEAPKGADDQAPEGSEGGEQSHGEEAQGDESESAEGEESETEHKGHAKKSKKHKR